MQNMDVLIASKCKKFKGADDWLGFVYGMQANVLKVFLCIIFHIISPSCSVPSPINVLTISSFFKPLPQKYAMGSDWFAGPVCCDLQNRLVRMQKHHALQHSGMCSICIANNGIVNIA